MNKKEILLGILIILILLFSFFGMSFFINTISGNSAENITFTGNQNITRNISIYLYSNVTSAYLNISQINGGQCYQESANVTNQTGIDGDCGLNYSGSYSDNTIYQKNYSDGNWSSYAQMADAEVYYVNYSKPIASTSAMWEFRTDRWVFSNFYLENLTIPYECFNASTDHIGLSITSFFPSTWSGVDFQCFNGTQYINLTSSLSRSSMGDGNAITEEGIYWNISYPTNPYIFLGNYKVWNFTGEFNQKNNKTDNLVYYLNTLLNNTCSGGTIIGNNCLINMTLHSDTIGILKYSDIQIIYNSIPNITLVSPSDNSVNGANISFISNISDITSLTNETLYIWNATGGLNATKNITLSGTYNYSSINYTFWSAGTYTWNILVYNNLSQPAFSNQNNTIIIELTNPIINQLFPSNNQWLKNKNISINCSITTGNANAGFLYGNFTGSYLLNQTNFSIVSGATTSFNVNNLNEGSYIWSCRANKTTGSTIYSAQQGNYTLNIDTIYPNVAINNITQTFGTLFSANSTTTDLHLQSCKFAVFNSSGRYDSLTGGNSTFTCNSLINSGVSDYGTYNLTVYSMDLAGNENYSTSTFSVNVSAVVVISSGGGGGGGGANSRVVALIKPKEDTNSYTSLSRAIIFAKIRNYTITYGDNKELNDLRINQLSEELKKSQVAVSPELLVYWDVDYLLKKYEVVEVLENQVSQYNLVKAEIIFGNEFAVNPAYINTYDLVSLCSAKDLGKNWTRSVSSTKVLKSCSILEGLFKCNLTSPSITEISYSYSNLDNSDFIFKSVEGKIGYISSDKEALSTKIQYINVINTCGKVNLGVIKLNLIFFVVSLLIIVTIGSIFIFRKRFKKVSLTKLINR